VKFIIFALIPLILSIGIISAIPFSDAVDYSPRNVSIKGTLIQSHTQDANTFWIILYDDKGTLVTSTDNGLVVLRFDFEDHDKCYAKENTFCLISVITESRNADWTKAGDVATIILEYPEKISFSALSGELVTNTFEFNIDKLRDISSN